MKDPDEVMSVLPEAELVDDDRTVLLSPTELRGALERCARSAPRSAESEPQRAPRARTGYMVLGGQLELQGPLGPGEPTTVYRAVDQRRAGARVAVKVFSLQGMRRPQALLERFARVRALGHPNIVTLYDLDSEDGSLFVTMPMLQGASLQEILEVIEPNRLPLAEAQVIIRALADALEYAHEHGLIHGHLTPENVFITEAREVKLLDLLSGHTVVDNPPRSPELVPRTSTALSYASPEVLEADPPDPRDDVYSLGCIAYQLLTGRLPYQGYSALQARQRRLTPPAARGLSRKQLKALRGALELARGRRTRTPVALAAALGADDVPVFATPDSAPLAASPRSRNYRALAAAVLVAAASASLVYASWPGAVDLEPARLSKWLSERVASVQPAEHAPADTDSTSESSIGPGRESTQTVADSVVSRTGTPRVEAAAPAERTPASEATRIAPPLEVEPNAGPATRAAPSAPLPQGAAADSREENAPAQQTDVSAATPTSAATDDAGHATASPVEQNAMSPDPGTGQDFATGPRVAAAQIAEVAPVDNTPRAASRPPGITFDAENYTVTEGGVVMIVIRAERNVAGPLSVTWGTQPDSATADEDYADFPAAVEQFTADELSRTIFIPLTSDELPEPAEVFHVTLRESSGGIQLGPISRATVTILDDD